MHCLTRKTLKCNSLVQKISMFLQKETSHCKSSLALGPQGSKHYIFGDHFYLKNARKLRFYVFLLFHARKHMISSFYLKWTKFTKIWEFYSNCGSRGPKLNWNKFTIFLEFGSLQAKWWYHMFSTIKMEEYMEFELPGIFWVKLVTKNMGAWVPGDPFYAYEG